MDVVEIIISAKNLTGPGFAEARRGMSALDTTVKKFHQTAAIAGVGMAVFLGESVKMASEFDSQMTRLNTQAGVSKDKIAGLSSGVLKLASEVGQSPQSLAKALYHVESNFESMGITSSKALELVKVAAQGATMGNADLVAVTNALTAAVASGIPGVSNMSEAMGVLNATVGVGDMTMQDLASAFGSGMVATVKGFGLSITDVGAALAVFGDNNIRGSLAGNQLRMSVMALANPIAGAGKALKSVGLEQDTLAKDMRKGGLKLALTDLMKHFKDAGIGAKQQGQIITEIFGRKAGAGLNVLLSQMDRFNSKYPALQEASKKFGKSWEETTKTFKMQTQQLQYGLESLMIVIGQKLIPVVQFLVKAMLDHKVATVVVIGAIMSLLTAMALLSLGAKLAAAAMWIFRDSAIAAEAGMEVSRIRALGMVAAMVAMRTAALASATASKVWAAVQVATAAVASTAVRAYTAIATSLAFMRAAYVNSGRGISGLVAAFSQLAPVQAFRNALTNVRTSAANAGGAMVALRGKITSLSTGTKLTGAVLGIVALVLALREFADIGKKAPPDIDKMTTAIGNLGRTGKVSGEALRVYGADFKGLVEAIKFDPASMSTLMKTLDKLGSGFGLFGDTLGSQYQGQISAFDQSLASLVQSGHADTAAAALKRFTDEGAKSGVSADKIKGQMTDYNSALAAVALGSSLTADSQGKFGAEAQKVQTQLAAQRLEADGLRNSLQALDAVYQATFNSQTKFEDAIAAVGKSIKDNGRTLNVYTDKGRRNRDTLSALAAATDDYTSKLADQHAGWDKVNGAYERGYKKLVDAAKGMGLNQKAAEKLAKSLLRVPKEVAVKAKIDDLEAKLAKAKKTLKSLPPSKQANIKATIKQLEAQLSKAKADLKKFDGSSATASVTTTYNYVTKGTRRPGIDPLPKKAFGGMISGPGSGTSDDVPLLASNGEFIVNAASTRKHRMLLEAINSGGMRAFRKGGSVSSSEKSARHDAQSELNISYYGQMAGRKRSSFGASFGSPASMSDLVDSLNRWRGIIKAATHGIAESHLLKSLNKAAHTLMKQEKALTKVNDALAKAKDKLTSLKDAAASLRDSVTSGINSSGNITGGVVQGKNTTASGLINNLQSKRDQSVALASALKDLKKRGLNKQSLSEIATAGIDGGGLDTATALLSGSGGDIKTVNALQKQIGAAAKSAGKTTADAMYAAGIKAADGLVKGLEKQQGKIEKVMEKAAKALEKAIEKAFKKKASGGPIGAAGGGPRSSWTMVGELGPELVRLPYGSSVKPHGQSMAMMGGGGGGIPPIYITVTLDGKVLGRQMVDPLRSEIYRLGGGSVQKALGRGAA